MLLYMFCMKIKKKYLKFLTRAILYSENKLEGRTIFRKNLTSQFDVSGDIL